MYSHGYLLGYSRQEVVGRNCRFLQGEKTEQTVLYKLRNAIAVNTNKPNLPTLVQQSNVISFCSLVGEEGNFGSAHKLPKG